MRELSAAVQSIVTSRSFTYFDHAEIQLPLGPGDAEPRVLHVSTAEIQILSAFDFIAFTYGAFAGVLARPPLAAEQSSWISTLETAFDTSPAALIAAADGLIDGLFTSAAYTARMRNDDQFVGDLYVAYLGRIADSEGKAFWLGQIVTFGRDSVREAFGTTPEFEARINRLNRPLTSSSDTREVGDLSFTDGATTDSIEFSFANQENTYSDLLTQEGRRLYPAPAVVGRAFKLPDGSYESVDLMPGFAHFGTVDGQVAKVMITSDMSPDGVDVVQEITQHCINMYKREGCDSPDTSPTCSRILNDTVNGCASKDAAPQLIDISPPDNRPSFRGVPQLAPTPSTGVGVPPEDQGPSGWPIYDYDPYDPTTRGGNYYPGILLY